MGKLDVYNQFTAQIATLTNQALVNGELTMKNFGKIVLVSMLDMLQKQVIINQAKILAESLASPESIATWGAAGLAKAAVIGGLVTAAVGVAKAAIGSFAEGGYTGEGDFRDRTGEKVAGIVHEKEFVINKRQTAKYKPLLDDINAGRDHAVWNALNMNLNQQQVKTEADYQKMTYDLLKKFRSYGQLNDAYVEHHPDTNTTIKTTKN